MNGITAPGSSAAAGRGSVDRRGGVPLLTDYNIIKASSMLLIGFLQPLKRLILFTQEAGKQFPKKQLNSLFRWRSFVVLARFRHAAELLFISGRRETPGQPQRLIAGVHNPVPDSDREVGR